jgi:outer membrane protein
MEFLWSRAGIGLVAALLVLVPEVAAAQKRQLTIDDAVALALERNRELAEARLELEESRHQVREAWANVFPTLDLNASYTRNLSVPANFLPRIFFDPEAGPDELVAVRFGADNAWGFTLRAEQPLFQAQAFVGVGAAGRYEEMQEEAVRGRAINVATATKLAYYDVLLADESLRLSENAVRRVTQTLDETRKMHEAGLASSYDVLRLEVELANVEPNLRRARNAAAAARRTLAVQAGLDELDGVEVSGSLSTIAGVPAEVTRLASAGGAAVAGSPAFGAPVPDAQDAMAQARAHRSELRQLELMQRLRLAELRAEQAEYLPRISLFGTYTINAQQSGSPAFFGRSEGERAYGRQLGIQVSMPLFGGFKRPARTAQRRAVMRQTEVQYEHLLDQVENQVRTLLEQVEETRERERAQRLALQQAQRGYEIATVQYREGISSALEVTDAELALRQSEFNYAEALYDALTARARLDAAIGVVPQVGDSMVVVKGEMRR